MELHYGDKTILRLSYLGNGKALTLNQYPGDRLNIKMSCQYRAPHVKDKTVSYIYHRDPIPGKDGLYIETGPRSQWYVHYILLPDKRKHWKLPQVGDEI